MKGNSYLKKTNDGLVPTAKGRHYLERIVTDVDGPVYCFRPGSHGNVNAAAMARLSRSEHDLRVTLLNEFAGQAGKSADLLRRVITGYGDDSVQQLLMIQFCCESVSNLATKRIEWGRLMAYLEQSTRYIIFDKKVRGRYRYHIPDGLDPATRHFYVEIMDRIFGLYTEVIYRMVEFHRANSSPPEGQDRKAWERSLKPQACDQVRPMLPAATTSSVGVVGSVQAVESLILHLASEDLPEFTKLASDILREARKIVPEFLERTDLPDRGGAIVAYMKSTREDIKTLTDIELRAAADLLKELDYHAPDADFSQNDVVLLDYSPRNEMDIIADLMFKPSKRPTYHLRLVAGKMPLERQHRMLAGYIGQRLNRRHKPGRAFEKIHYQWEITGDYGTFRDLQRHRMVDQFEWQDLTTEYGYDVPEAVKKAGQGRLYREAFELSSRLYYYMVDHGYPEAAQYATLLGHKMRYRFMMNVREAFHLHELRTTPQGHPGYRKIVLKMHELLTKVHPKMGEAMKFVNKGEDPELTRLAGELATARKLALLGYTEPEEQQA